MTVSTHVLDAARGCPGAGVPVAVHRRTDDGGWVELAGGSTDADGRLRFLGTDGGPLSLDPGTHRIDFDTSAYFAATGQHGFYPQVSIAFAVSDPLAHHHLPLLLSPFAYSTYRGS